MPPPLAVEATWKRLPPPLHLTSTPHPSPYTTTFVRLVLFNLLSCQLYLLSCQLPLAVMPEATKRRLSSDVDSLEADPPLIDLDTPPVAKKPVSIVALKLSCCILPTNLVAFSVLIPSAQSPVGRESNSRLRRLATPVRQ